jgi:hypothetical protein
LKVSRLKSEFSEARLSRALGELPDDEVFSETQFSQALGCSRDAIFKRRKLFPGNNVRHGHKVYWGSLAAVKAAVKAIGGK